MNRWEDVTAMIADPVLSFRHGRVAISSFVKFICAVSLIATGILPVTAAPQTSLDVSTARCGALGPRISIDSRIFLDENGRGRLKPEAIATIRRELPKLLIAGMHKICSSKQLSKQLPFGVNEVEVWNTDNELDSSFAADPRSSSNELDRSSNEPRKVIFQYAFTRPGAMLPSAVDLGLSWRCFVDDNSVACRQPGSRAVSPPELRTRSILTRVLLCRSGDIGAAMNDFRKYFTSRNGDAHETASSFVAYPRFQLSLLGAKLLRVSGDGGEVDWGASSELELKGALSTVERDASAVYKSPGRIVRTRDGSRAKRFPTGRDFPRYAYVSSGNSGVVYLKC